MLPFTQEQFFAVFAAYNDAIWPAAIAAYPMAMIAVLIAWRGAAGAGPPVAIVIAVMWAWVGLVYHGIYFSEINPVALAFAGAFVLQALLFAIEATRGRFGFASRSRLRATAGAIMIFYAMIAYPLVGLAVGERYPAMPLFGVAPCPLLIFTFGLMLWATCVRWWLWIVPLFWSIVGGSAFIVLSVPQDWGLPLAAVGALGVLLSDRVRTVSASGVYRRRGRRTHPN